MKNEDTPKYVVFKSEDWELYGKRLSEGVGDPGPIEDVRDAVVIRRQDVFAPSALYGYAHAVQISLEIGGDLFSDRKREELEAIRDYFWEQGSLAQEEHNRKLPTL